MQRKCQIIMKKIREKRLDTDTKKGTFTETKTKKMFTKHFLSSPENQAKIRAVHEASQCKEALAKARQAAFKKVLVEEKEAKKKKKNHLQSRYCKSETTTNGSKGGW